MNSWIIENLGWTLLHSFWQITFVALILFVALRVLREFSANLKYFASILGLSLSLILPIATFVYLSTSSKPIQNSSYQASMDSPKDVSPTVKPKPISETSHSSPPISSSIAVTSSSPNIPFLPILVVIWLIGVLFFSIRLAGGVWTVHLYKTRKVSAVENHWQEKFDEFCESLQLRRKIKFLQSQMVEMPVVIGWLKPVVLIPASAFLQISPKELETILIHELIHIKRHDYLINLVQSFAEILFFFHPCVWWISAHIRAEREFAVDEFVAQMFETERFIYAKALANLEESRTTAPILAMAADGGNLMKRIEKILNGSRKINSTNVSIWSAVFAVTFVLGLTVGTYWIKASEIKKSKNGRKIAVVFSNFSPKKEENQHYQKLLELQKKYGIPATWLLETELIEKLQQDGQVKDFFLQAHENRSDFIIYFPNIDSTIFENGDDEYIALWQKRMQEVNEVLNENGDKLKYWSAGGRIRTQIKDTFTKQNIKFISRPMTNEDLFFPFFYERDCVRAENGMSCQDTNAEKQKEVREKYLLYMNEMFELNEKYSQEKFGAETPQILSLGTNKLTNDSADELLQMLQDKGYEFVPLEEVISNESYKLQEKPTKDSDLFYKRWKILKKYLPENFPNPKTTVENSKIKFNVEVTTKDLKVKQY